MQISVPKEFPNQNSPVPNGIYRVAYTGYKTRTSANGNFMINPEFTIQTQEGPNGEKVGGRKLFTNWTLTENALPVMNSAFKVLTGEDLPAGNFEIDEFVNMVTSRLQGTECLVQVEVDSNDRANIKRWTKISA